jgi:hypothetical protein
VGSNPATPTDKNAGEGRYPIDGDRPQVSNVYLLGRILGDDLGLDSREKHCGKARRRWSSTATGEPGPRS